MNSTDLMLVVFSVASTCCAITQINNTTAIAKMKKHLGDTSFTGYGGMLLKTKTFTGGRCGFRRGANRPSYQFLFNVWRQQLRGRRNANCDTLFDTGTTTDGAHSIDIRGTDLQVICDFQFNGYNWIMIQRRMMGGGLLFNVNWAAYQNGFGTMAMNNEFWLGLNAIHQLTFHLRRPVLRIDLTAAGGATAYAEYKIFRVAGQARKYRLRIGGYTGTADDGMSYHNGSPFSTMDNDNDQEHFSRSCAALFGGGGWWYRDCYTANLHGSFSGTTAARDTVNWYFWQNNFANLMVTEMRIRNG